MTLSTLFVDLSSEAQKTLSTLSQANNTASRLAPLISQRTLLFETLISGFFYMRMLCGSWCDVW